MMSISLALRKSTSFKQMIHCTRSYLFSERAGAHPVFMEPFLDFLRRLKQILLLSRVFSSKPPLFQSDFEKVRGINAGKLFCDVSSSFRETLVPGPCFMFHTLWCFMITRYDPTYKTEVVRMYVLSLIVREVIPICTKFDTLKPWDKKEIKYR
jgi:hypothetical protein